MRKPISLALTLSVLALVSCYESRSQSCNNWLYLPPGAQANVGIGDLDMSGNQLTVEAVFTRTTPYDPLYHGGDLVSKHTHDYDNNYLLRPNLGCLLTSTQFYVVQSPCPAQVNVTYHVAMVYDGSTLSLYRNGVLQQQIPATGNLFLQDIPAQIGYYNEAIANSSFEGYINEVRIWKVARSQANLRTYMNTSLPNPATQAGLVAYYSFDNAVNKQGTSAWDGVLHNGAQVNQTNPFCNVNTEPPGPTGTLTGSNTCNGAPGLLTFHSGIGPGPLTLVYTDGTTSYTQTNVMDGEPFSLQVQPAVSTTYTLVSAQAASGCLVLAMPGISATVNPGNCTLCTGSLGDPIINATFGSGTGSSPPLEQVIPGASTNLVYQPTSGSPATPTPLDGHYTISNTVPVNSSGNYWLTGGKDHTGDPNGYMLYENPGTGVGEFYRQKLTTLCGGGKYEFAAWIAQSANPATVPGIVPPDLTFIVQTEDGTVLATYNSGPVPVYSSFTWNKFGFFFTLPSGISTAIVRILDNNAGGTNVHGNDFALDDITFRPCGPDMTVSPAVGQPATVCPGTSVTFTATVTGGYTLPAYIWQVSADSGKTWRNPPSAGNTQYTVTTPAATTDIAYQFRILAAEAPNINSPSCRVASAPAILVVRGNPTIDFGFDRQPCDPLQVRLTAVGSSSGGYTWNIDGTDYAPPDPADQYLDHAFPDNGDHLVTLKGTGVCGNLTVPKTISLALQPADIVVTPDANICAGATVQLTTKPALSWCWSPAAGLSDPVGANPVASPAVTTKYHYTALVAGSNLVINGDFSAGNASFLSDYLYNPASGFNGGVYSVGPTPLNWLSANGPACKDHTNGAGNMLLVNGAQQTDVRVWSQTVNVQPNTNYAFSAWLENISTVNPAILQFSINGLRLGAPLTANVNSCVWDQYHTVWNSGSAATAVISIVNENTGFSGNDFALDDISFAPVEMMTDSVTIDIETPSVNAVPSAASVCPGAAQQLKALGAVSYSWSPVAGLDNAAVADPVYSDPGNAATGAVPYIVTGTTARGCFATATVYITQLPRSISLGPVDTVVCRDSRVRLYGAGGNSYSWSPAALLDNAGVASPLTSRIGSSTKYVLTIKDLNNCTETDSLVVHMRPVPTFKAPPDQSICAGFNVLLTSDNDKADNFLWVPADGLDNATAAVPDASPSATTIYQLYIADPVCSFYDSVFNVRVEVRPRPTISADKGNDIDCAVHTTQLHASGGVSYIWSPATGLSSPYSPVPTASIDSTTTYVVKGTASNGCYAFDSVTVSVTATGANTFVVPNAFSPNGDGVNDCFGLSRWGDVQLEELEVFNRQGMRVFTARNPSQCWDGTFQGQAQPAGTYVYIIKARTFCGEVTRRGTVVLIR